MYGVTLYSVNYTIRKLTNKVLHYILLDKRVTR